MFTPIVTHTWVIWIGLSPSPLSLSLSLSLSVYLYLSIYLSIYLALSISLSRCLALSLSLFSLAGRQNGLLPCLLCDLDRLRQTKVDGPHTDFSVCWRLGFCRSLVLRFGKESVCA